MTIVTMWFTFHVTSKNLQITLFCKNEMSASLYESLFKKYDKIGLSSCNLIIVLWFGSVQTPLSTCPLLLREKAPLFTLLLS